MSTATVNTADVKIMTEIAEATHKQLERAKCAYCGKKFVADKYDCCSCCGAPKDDDR